MKKVPATLISLYLVVTGMFIYFWLNDNQIPGDHYAQARQANIELFQNPITETRSKARIPDSLSGIEFAPELQIDEKKNLIPSYAIRELFEHYLSTFGEADIKEIISLIQMEINTALEEPARSEAIELLKRYIDYKIALAEYSQTVALDSDGDMPYFEQVAGIQAEIQALRASFFNLSEYDSFFSREDAQNAFMIEQLRINADSSLSEPQRTAQLAQARSLLPEDIAERREQTQQHANLREQVTAIRAEGASDEEVFRLRESALGTQAAMNLAKLDEERQLWKYRLAAFSQERQSILDSSLSQSDKHRSIEDLLAARFGSSERKRVRAIMGDGRLYKSTL